MLQVLLLASMLSIDSLIASMALGMLGLRRLSVAIVVVLFGACDVAATLAGGLASSFLVNESVVATKFEAVTLLLYAAILARIWYILRAKSGTPRIQWFYLLPVLLSADNFFLGVSRDVRSVPTWLWLTSLGLISASMSVLGFRIGSGMRARSSAAVLNTSCVGLLCFLMVSALH